MLALNTVKNQLDLPSELFNDVLALIKWMKSFEFVVNTTFWIKALRAINDVNVTETFVPRRYLK